jgi:hypothetical protein
MKIGRNDGLTPESNDLCCKIHPQAVCSYCGHVMCRDCAQAWSGRKHFIIDMCRSRFSAKELKEAAECFKKRLGPKGEMPFGLGTCKICNAKKTLRVNDRALIEEEDEHL